MRLNNAASSTCNGSSCSVLALLNSTERNTRFFNDYTLASAVRIAEAKNRFD